jgi:tubulin polyglutamylase TTLL4
MSRTLWVNYAIIVYYGQFCSFDILLDEMLRPWLLEVNISPALQSGTPLDLHVKAPLAHDVLNLSGIQLPNRDAHQRSINTCSHK